jgi:hypothetical protein
MPFASGRLTSLFILRGWSECNTFSFVMWYVAWAWKLWPLSGYDARCLLMGLEVANALFARNILCGRIDCADLTLLLRFEEFPYSKRRNAGLMSFFHWINTKYCHWFGFYGKVSRYMFRGSVSVIDVYNNIPWRV